MKDKKKRERKLFVYINEDILSLFNINCSLRINPIRQE